MVPIPVLPHLTSAAPQILMMFDKLLALNQLVLVIMLVHLKILIPTLTHACPGYTHIDICENCVPQLFASQEFIPYYF